MVPVSLHRLDFSPIGSRSLRLVVIAALSLLMLSCRDDQQPETTGSTLNACATNLYANYNPANMEQCVNVCLRCERGVMTTCSTSCKLKGAH